MARKAREARRVDFCHAAQALVYPLGEACEVALQTRTGRVRVQGQGLCLAYVPRHKRRDPLPLVLIAPLRVEIHAQDGHRAGCKAGELAQFLRDFHDVSFLWACSVRFAMLSPPSSLPCAHEGLRLSWDDA